MFAFGAFIALLLTGFFNAFLGLFGGLFGGGGAV